MQLSFLGRAYNSNTPAIDVTETEETVRFLGQAAQVKQFSAEQSYPRAEMRFLGRRYSR
ncbi:MAG: hypothetical protein VKI82_08635 [Leptolyngbya sp.]|nr:hypothetical protein [Leptolyngbya sp.]